MEGLGGQVGAIGDELFRGMPGWIDACAQHAIGLQVHLSGLSVVADDGSAQMLPDMELHAARVLLLEGVAVDALGIPLRAVYHIAVDDALTSYKWYKSDAKDYWGKYFDDDHFLEVSIDSIAQAIINIVSNSAEQDIEDETNYNENGEISW